MRNSEVVFLITANANKTHNIRCYSGSWSIIPDLEIPNNFATQFGHIIGLLQANIDAEKICKKDEMILIRSLHQIQEDYYELEIIIRPRYKIKNTQDTEGKHLSLFINTKTMEVMNISKAAIELGMKEQEFKNKDYEPPISYGKYSDHPTPCCFIAMVSYKPIQDFQEVFDGRYDKSELLENCQAFDSLTEAREFLKNKTELGKYIGEIVCPKEKVKELKLTGLGKEIAKIFDFVKLDVVVTPIQESLQKEGALEDELKRLDKILADNRPEFTQLALKSLESAYGTEGIEKLLSANSQEAADLTQGCPLL